MDTSKVDPSLIQAYVETEYRVSDDPPFVLKVGVASEQLLAAYNARGLYCAFFITVYNPFSQKLSDAANMERHRRFEEELVSQGQPYLNAVGHNSNNDWPAEPGFLVFGSMPEEARALGECWEQNAVVYCGEHAVPELMLLR